MKLFQDVQTFREINHRDTLLFLHFGNNKWISKKNCRIINTNKHLSLIFSFSLLQSEIRAFQSVSRFLLALGENMWWREVGEVGSDKEAAPESWRLRAPSWAATWIIHSGPAARWEPLMAPSGSAQGKKMLLLFTSRETHPCWIIHTSPEKTHTHTQTHITHTLDSALMISAAEETLWPLWCEEETSHPRTRDMREKEEALFFGSKMEQIRSSLCFKSDSSSSVKLCFCLFCVFFPIFSLPPFSSDPSCVVSCFILKLCTPFRSFPFPLFPAPSIPCTLTCLTCVSSSPWGLSSCFTCFLSLIQVELLCYSPAPETVISFSLLFSHLTHIHQWKLHCLHVGHRYTDVGNSGTCGGHAVMLWFTCGPDVAKSGPKQSCYVGSSVLHVTQNKNHKVVCNKTSLSVVSLRRLPSLITPGVRRSSADCGCEC